MVRIEFYDHGRWFVDTGSGNRYLVDTEEFPTREGFCGWCGCKHYQYTILPTLQKEEAEGACYSRRRCKHLEAIFEYLSKQEPKP